MSVGKARGGKRPGSGRPTNAAVLERQRVRQREARQAIEFLARGSKNPAQSFVDVPPADVSPDVARVPSVAVPDAGPAEDPGSAGSPSTSMVDDPAPSFGSGPASSGAGASGVSSEPRSTSLLKGTLEVLAGKQFAKVYDLSGPVYNVPNERLRQQHVEQDTCRVADGRYLVPRAVVEAFRSERGTHVRGNTFRKSGSVRVSN